MYSISLNTSSRAMIVHFVFMSFFPSSFSMLKVFFDQIKILHGKQKINNSTNLIFFLPFELHTNKLYIQRPCMYYLYLYTTAVKGPSHQKKPTHFIWLCLQFTLSGLTIPHFCACPKPVHEFPTMVRFDDFGGIVDHHCLTFLFIARLVKWR